MASFDTFPRRRMFGSHLEYEHLLPSWPVVHLLIHPVHPQLHLEEGLREEDDPHAKRTGRWVGEGGGVGVVEMVSWWRKVLS